MERIKLNLIPSGVAPIVHLSQYDDGRQFGIDLFEGESVYVLDGTETLTVNSRKPDGHVVTLSVTNTGTSSLDVDTIEQLTAVHGVSYAKLKIEKGSVTVATLPFLIDVSRDPLENGDPSESFVDNLQTQIALAVADQYDSNNVFFDNVPTSGHGIGYAVTSEGVKTEVDNLNTALAGKVDTTDFDATNLPITSGSATDTKSYIDSKTAYATEISGQTTFLNNFSIPAWGSLSVLKSSSMIVISVLGLKCDNAISDFTNAIELPNVVNVVYGVLRGGDGSIIPVRTANKYFQVGVSVVGVTYTGQIVIPI